MLQMSKRRWRIVFFLLVTVLILMTGCVSSKYEKTVTIKDFEDLGFIYSEEFSGGDEDYFRFKLTNDAGASISVSVSLRIVLYRIPTANSVQMLIIANEDADDYSNVGHGVAMSQAGIQNMYQLATLIAENHDEGFISCLPEDLHDVIKEHDLRVLISGGAFNNVVSKTGRWDTSGTEIWSFEICSPNYFYYNNERDTGEKGVHLTFFTGENPDSGILGTSPAGAIGTEGVSAKPEFEELYNSLRDEMAKDGNSFDPETLKMTLTPESIEALKAVLPYLDMP